MYLESVKIFCDVVRKRSFSRAAAANNVSQSAVSQNVLQLEKSLGVRLIDRSKRPFELTPAGQAYYDGCKGIVERYYAVEAEVRTLHREVAGAVGVAAIYSVGLGAMSGYVQRFASRYPRASVRLAYLHPDSVYESVISEVSDIGLVSCPKARRGLVALPWREEPMVLACSPRHALAGSASVRARELDGERLVAFDETLALRREVDRELKRKRVEMQVVLSFDNIETIKRAVEIGEGVSLLPAPTVEREVQAGSLVAVRLADLRLTRRLGIIHRKNGELPRAARCFLELLREEAKAGEDGSADVSVAAAGGNGRVLPAEVTVG